MNKLFHALSVVLLISGWCRATENQLEFNYGRGFMSASDHLEDALRQKGPRGPQWSADFLHKASPGVYLGLGGGHFHSGEDMSDTFAPNAGSERSLKTTSILALGRIDLSPNPKFTPYAMAGAGWVRNSLNVIATPNTPWSDTGTSEPRILVDDSKSTLGYALGIGVDMALTDRLFLGVEGRYQGSIKRSFDTTPAGLAATGQSQVAIPLGAYLFGIKAGIKY